MCLESKIHSVVLFLDDVILKAKIDFFHACLILGVYVTGVANNLDDFVAIKSSTIRWEISAQGLLFCPTRGEGVCRLSECGHSHCALMGRRCWLL